MLHRQAAIDQLVQRINPDAEMFVGEFARDLFVARCGLDAFGRHRLIRDEQQRASGDLVVESRDENRGRLHVYADATNLPQIRFELFIMFPHAAVGRINRARPVIAFVIPDGAAPSPSAPRPRPGARTPRA